AQHLGEQPVVLGRVGAVDAVVGAHDGVRRAALDRALEGVQVDLAQRALVDLRRDAHAVGLLVVDRVVLERGAHALGLHAADERGRELPREHGVLGEVLEVAPAQRVALDVRTRAEQDGHTVRAGLDAERLPDALEQLEVPRRAERGGGREARRGLGRGEVEALGGRCEAHPVRAVGHGDRGDAEAFDRDARPRGRSRRERDLLLERELAEQSFDVKIGHGSSLGACADLFVRRAHASGRTLRVETIRPRSGSWLLRGRTRARGSDLDEHRVALPDRADLDGLAGARRIDLLVAAEVDPDVAGRPDDVADLGLLLRHDLARVALGRGRARQGRDAGLLVDVLHEARAVEARARARATTAVAHAPVLECLGLDRLRLGHDLDADRARGIAQLLASLARDAGRGLGTVGDLDLLGAALEVLGQLVGGPALLELLRLDELLAEAELDLPGDPLALVPGVHRDLHAVLAAHLALRRALDLELGLDAL